MCSANPSLGALHERVFHFASELSEQLKPQTSAYAEIWLDKKQIAGFEDTEPLYGEYYLVRPLSASGSEERQVADALMGSRASSRSRLLSRPRTTLTCTATTLASSRFSTSTRSFSVSTSLSEVAWESLSPFPIVCLHVKLLCTDLALQLGQVDLPSSR